MTGKHDLCIVGGGPAGMMAGLLFARAGVRTLVLEKHRDFLRDFRGDTVHPSTMDLFADLGLLEDFLRLPHNRVDRIRARVSGQLLDVADFRHLHVAAPFIAMMPQWDLLDWLASKAARYPAFSLRMEAEATDIVCNADGRVSGVGLADGSTVEAGLVIAADGRGSVIRERAGLVPRRLGAPIDVFWLRIAKTFSEANETFGIFQSGAILILIDRGDYWQAAYVFAKGEENVLRNAGLQAFKNRLLALEPRLAEGLSQIMSMDDVKTLSVALDRLECWHRPGLLAIGDAAHAMSPVGGVGINLAVQDAVAAANILAAPMAEGRDPDVLLADVQARRQRPVKRMQALQRVIQNRLIVPLIATDSRRLKPSVPLPLRLLDRFPVLQRIPARIIGLGFGRERVQSPAAE